MIRADLIAAGLHLGCVALSRATIPDEWGQDMDVPDSILKSKGNISLSIMAGEAAGDHEAKMLTPGAAMSGYKRRWNMLITRTSKTITFSRKGRLPSIQLVRRNWAL